MAYLPLCETHYIAALWSDSSLFFILLNRTGLCFHENYGHHQVQTPWVLPIKFNYPTISVCLRETNSSGRNIVAMKNGAPIQCQLYSKLRNIYEKCDVIELELLFVENKKHTYCSARMILCLYGKMGIYFRIERFTSHWFFRNFPLRLFILFLLLCHTNWPMPVVRRSIQFNRVKKYGNRQ